MPAFYASRALFQINNTLILLTINCIVVISLMMLGSKITSNDYVMLDLFDCLNDEKILDNCFKQFLCKEAPRIFFWTD